MKLVSIFLLATLAFPVSSFASETKNAWTQCGLGAMIFNHTGWAAAISNVIWDWGTTAVTSSSSSPSQCAGSSASVGKLIYENYANVEEETAVGHGEHLTAMLGILKCDGAIQTDFISDVRGEFSNSVKNPTYEQKSQLEKTESLLNNVMDKAVNKYAGRCTVS